MGAWSTTSFGNDAALDWAGDMQESGSVAVIRSVLTEATNVVRPNKASFIKRLLGGRSYDIGLKARSCCQAIAAAEFVAAWKGRPSKKLPAGVESWIINHSTEFSDDLIELAIKALLAISQKSELKLLWEERDEATVAEWHSAIADLKARLEGEI